MMSLWCARLTFLDRIHFGSLGVGLESIEETLHSDSLYSALCHAWSTLFGADDLRRVIARFFSAPPFLLSSAFPYWQETFFLPKPMTRLPGFADAATRQADGKLLKETTYLPRELFVAWIQGHTFPLEQIATANSLIARMAHRELIPRVALGRDSAMSEIFHVGVLRFAPEGGLYFLIRLQDDTLAPNLRAALHLLGEMGVGGERTYGLGRFTVRLEPADAPWMALEVKAGPRHLTLALFCPPPEDLDRLDEACAYGLIERKGWIHSPYTYRQLKRKSVTMFAEGSVFAQALAGQVLDVTPAAWDRASSHPIYRFALPFYVGVQS
jgi:CRISPR-associated protein Csm4